MTAVNRAQLVRCNGCDALMGNVISTLCRHDRECPWHPATGCTHDGYCYRSADDETEVLVLPADCGTSGLSLAWAARALDGDYGPLCDEDREMAEAAYARGIDVQLGVAGKGTHKGMRETFPIGDVVRREDEESAAAAEDGALFSLEAVTA